MIPGLELRHAQLHLEVGLYHFRTLNEAQLRVISGGVPTLLINSASVPPPKCRTSGLCSTERIGTRFSASLSS